VNPPGVPAASADPAPDPHRPAFHFLPPSGWMNDPNGLLVVDGRLHLFYQHNPDGPFHDRIQWGHAVSDDLLHWRYLPIALTPDPNGPDAHGCWSGCAVVHDGVPTLLYTGIQPQVQCLASGDGDWQTWRKHPTPVIAGPPPGVPVVGDPPEMRDPWLWRQDGTWHLLLGSGLAAPDGRADGALLHYRSDDLRAWRYLGVAHRGRFGPDTLVWECPNLFELDGHHVVLVSEQLEFRHTYAQTGTFDGATFTPAWSGIADHGHVFYAGLTVEHPVHRRLLFGWIKEGRPDAVVRARSRWSGALSLARVLGVDAQGRLTMGPAPEYAALRRDPHGERGLMVPDGDTRSLEDLRSDALELSLRVDVPPGARLLLELRATDDGAETTRVVVDGTRRTIEVDTTRSTLDPEIAGDLVAAPTDTDSPLELRVFLDRSIVEVFAGATTCITARAYATRPDATGVTLRAEGGDVAIERLEGWRMASVW
jgi:beta-fructofuranosidase